MHIIKGAIDAVALDEFRMSTAFGYLAFVKYINAVAGGDGGEAVRHDDSGSAFQGVVDGRLNDVFAFGIKGGGRFIKEEDLRFADNRSGNGQALPFTTGNSHPTLAEKRIKLLGEFLNEAEGIGDLQGVPYFIVGDSAFAKEDIITNAVVEKYVLLRHDTEAGEVAFEAELSDVEAVDSYDAAFGVIKAEDKVQHGRFAAPTGADECYFLAFPYAQGDSPQYIGADVIAEDEIANGEVALE